MKSACIVIFFMFLLILFPISTKANQTSDSFSYTVEEGGAVITGYTGEGGSLTIPDTLDGYPVAGIGDGTFQNCSTLTAVTFPEGLASIGDYAFSGCAALISVAFPEGLMSIGESVFQGCISLESIAFPKSLPYIGFLDFAGCTSLASITFSEGLIAIQERAFQDCTSLTSVTLPKSLLYVNNSVFNGCTSLNIVSLPKELIILGSSVFAGCTSLTFVALPSKLASIGESVFYGCTSLTSVTVPAMIDCINYQTFYGCTSLITVTLPRRLTCIDFSAFYGCTSLVSVTFPMGLTSIYDDAFHGCTSLESVAFPGELTSIGASAFYGCTSLTDITFSNGLETIGNNAFTACTSLASVTLPQMFPYGNAAGYCEWLATISVEEISGGTFHSLVAWGGGAEIIGYTGMVENLAIPDILNGYPVTKIGVGAFSGNSFLTTVTFPKSLESIGESAFDGCTSLVSIVIPTGVTNLESGAFASCISLRSVSMPVSIPMLKDQVFRNCPALTGIEYYGATLSNEYMWTPNMLKTRKDIDLSAFTPSNSTENACLMLLGDDSQIIVDNVITPVVSIASNELLQTQLEPVKEAIATASNGKLYYTANPDEASVLIQLDIEFLYVGMYRVNTGPSKKGYDWKLTMTVTDMRTHIVIATETRNYSLNDYVGFSFGWTEGNDAIWVDFPNLNMQAIVDKILGYLGETD